MLAGRFLISLRAAPFDACNMVVATVAAVTTARIALGLVQMLPAGVDVLAGRLAAGAIAMARIVLPKEFVCKIGKIRNLFKISMQYNNIYFFYVHVYVLSSIN